MEIRKALMRHMTDHITNNVDQLCDEVVDFYEITRGGSDEDDGDWSTAEVRVSYRVPTEINRMGFAHWYWTGTLEDLIYEMDRSVESATTVSE